MEKERIQKEKEERQKKEAEESESKEHKGEEKVDVAEHDPTKSNDDKAAIPDDSPSGQVGAPMYTKFSKFKTSLIFLN